MPLRKQPSYLLAALRPGRGASPEPSLQASDVRIIVLDWNNRDVTLACLESLARARLDDADIYFGSERVAS